MLVLIMILLPTLFNSRLFLAPYTLLSTLFLNTIINTFFLCETKLHGYTHTITHKITVRYRLNFLISESAKEIFSEKHL